MKMWKENGNTTTLLFSLKGLVILHQERRGKLNTIVIEHSRAFSSASPDLLASSISTFFLGTTAQCGHLLPLWTSSISLYPLIVPSSSLFCIFLGSTIHNPSIDFWVFLEYPEADYRICCIPSFPYPSYPHDLSISVCLT